MAIAAMTHSIQFVGGTASIIDVQCHMAQGLPALTVVGMANKSIDESKERIRAAFTSSGISFPKKKITINLAPADMQKLGSSFDVAIAVAILLGMQAVKVPKLTMFFGELGLDGATRPIRGIVGKLLGAQEAGFTCVVVPKDNLEQALLVPGLTVVAVSSLKELYDHFTGTVVLQTVQTGDGVYNLPIDGHATGPDIAEVMGQERAKRALLVAAAGGHNIMLSGPPGMGKSMLAKTLPGILPSLSHEEALRITHIHSLGLNDSTKTVYERPFRSPHHSASDVAIVGGGQNPRPGEITMAHGGVLFLDEFPEFRRATIESLRQPLEDGTVTVSRAKETVAYPARFMLVATRNPCPCGYFGSTHECTCTASQIQSYNKKLSGPIMDRIDIHVTVDQVDHKDLLTTSKEKASQKLRAIVERVRNEQSKRYKSTITNAAVSTRLLKETCLLSSSAEELLNAAAEKLDISPRVYMKTIKLARTIADLDTSASIEPHHISEALQYRPVKTSL